jgi:hypothetical protein
VELPPVKKLDFLVNDQLIEFAVNCMPKKIVCSPDDLQEGLFGQVLLYVFEVLPYLDFKQIVPTWEIRSKLYGEPENDFIVIPGLLDTQPEHSSSDLQESVTSLVELREKFPVTLGNDWNYIHELWHKYFSIPDAIAARADQFPDLTEALGLHYRGTDKNKALEETNFVSEADFIKLADDFIQDHPSIKVIFIASDEDSFVEQFRSSYPNHQIVNSGSVIHHKEQGGQDNTSKGEHALLDCLLLSRCRYLLKCQSALSGFAKVLNPKIEAYRVSANKLAYWNRDVPYFPDGFLPKYSSRDSACQELLDRLFEGDWTSNAAVARRFASPVGYEHRGRKRRLLNRLDRWTFGVFGLNWAR